MRVFIDVKELSRLLRLKESSLYYLVRKGLVPSFRIGNHIRFHRGQIEKWLKECMNYPYKTSTGPDRSADKVQQRAA